ncbi:helix-turn-helix transcriptional regulator [Achromobacter sp. Marseille-Q0513]|uniref:helix-turn-helix domain-containing protein n=1 Tax=Achromobacter sp. Marseille-Q0513 TaxID=2829161 RepID=UPI001B9EE421|nr:helix-turn-helix transcriptional regulator [Achromobacter sp. Marseille-Q0513]MBR8657561.1 helix-turn-helix transcriptional regulator [Achromobacter sp. Marseille-Q0513]
MSFNLASTAEILRALGSRLRTQRLAQGLPQRELAQMAGLSLGALRKLEGSGQSSLETLIRVTQALGLAGELEDLFVLRRQSIAQMAQAESAGQRQRAPRRSKT